MAGKNKGRQQKTADVKVNSEKNSCHSADENHGSKQVTDSKEADVQKRLHPKDLPHEAADKDEDNNIVAKTVDQLNGDARKSVESDPKKNKKDLIDKGHEAKKPVKRKATEVDTAKPAESQPSAKKSKFTSSHSIGDVKVALPSNPGFVLVVGEGDTGQLGLGPDVMDRSKPGRVNLPANVVQVCAGGMHSVCLTQSGEVFTFGCNDEGALGRKVDDEDECMSPGKVELSEKIVMVSAGDSHTAALSNDGNVYIWGTFRDSNGPIGILPDHGKIETPLQIMKSHNTIKIASGCDHLVCLTAKGELYSMGAAEQGQLGRVPECFTARGGRRGLGFLLEPALVACKKRSVRFSNVWTGSYYTFAKDKDTGEIYAWGLNNYFQLGIDDMKNKFIPEKCRSFAKEKNWMSISGGQHHTLALDGTGKVYSFGRKEYGRLGLGEDGLEEKSGPTLIPKLQNLKCVDVNSGSAVSYAVAEDGAVYVWGMGSTKQLGQGDDEDDIYVPTVLTGKQLENKKGLMVSAGGQHTMFLAQDRS